MPGSIVKSADGTKHYVIPITGAVKRNADGIKVRLGEWAGSDSPLRDSEWVQANCGDALTQFLPGKLPGSSTARLGMATVIDAAEYTVDSLVEGGRVRLVDSAGNHIETTLDNEEVNRFFPHFFILRARH